MEGLDYPIEHFEQMVRLAIALKGCSAQVLEQTYHYSAFGSWVVIFLHREQPLRIVFDGRDREYVLEESASQRRPYEWRGVLWRTLAPDAEEVWLPDLVAAIERRA